MKTARKYTQIVPVLPPAGFTLLETMVALVVMLVGLISLAYVLGAELNFMSMSQDEFLCQQKAAEAVESIFTARNTQLVSWAQIDNVSNGGIFLDGPQPLLDPGIDGILGTADDNPALPDAIIAPGPDGILGDADDTRIILWNFTRQIAIQDNIFSNPNLKQITVTVTYKIGTLQRTYTLVSYISSFS
jgi:prepilin-type N-terminal cleavage/methylation domain-containing protein